MKTASKRDPSTEAGHKLEETNCLVTAAFSKPWAQSPGYWMGVYTRLHPHPHGTLRFYWLHRQWAFFKKGGELVADDYTSKPCTSVSEVAEMFLDQYIRLTVEKNYELSSAEFRDEELEDAIRAMISNSEDSLVVEHEVRHNNSLSLRFRRAQEEREKNTKW